MTTKYRHVLPNLGHFAAYIHRHPPYGETVPLIDRVLVTRIADDGESEDMIVGTIIHKTRYKEADLVEKDTMFMGYVDPLWLKANQRTIEQYNASLQQWGKEWEQRSTPVVVPVEVEKLFGEPDFPEEEESTPPPVRRRKGR